MAKKKILVAEDDSKIIIFIVDQLEYLGYQVSIARDGIETLKKVSAEPPDLIILDVMMPKMDGYEVCRRLKSDDVTQDIPILMLTAKGQVQDKVKGFALGADDYLPKPYDKDEFEARVKALLRRSAAPPFSHTHPPLTLYLSCKPERRVNVRVNGIFAFNDTTKGVLELDVEMYARQADNTPKLDWRFNSKHWGKLLYQALFIDHPEILSTHNQALGAAERDKLLHLRLETPRDLLRVPFEFMFEKLYDGGDYLVLKYPLSRSVMGIKVKRPPITPEFLNALWTKKEPLRILLIASNTRPPIPGVDQEISALSNDLKSLFANSDIPVNIKTISTDQATYETVRKELRKNTYHLLHYAGHGAYDTQSPENSSLYFWEQPNRQGGVKPMPISELQMLLRDSDFHFIYLSCCLGATTGTPTKLLDDDFLGIVDGLIHAGIPSVLGFRWPVSDYGAQALALAFYESLSQQGEIDTALYDARCEVAARHRDDITWLSPILVMQGS